MKIKDAIASLKKDIIYPIYLLRGNDHFLQNFFIEKLSEEYFGSSKIEKVLMLPDDMSGKEIVDRITTTDLFSTKKIFIIRGASQLIGPSGAASPIWSVTEQSGKSLFIESLADTYRDYKAAADGDDYEATLRFVQEFGLDPTAILTSKSRSVVARPQTVFSSDWARKNKDLYNLSKNPLGKLKFSWVKTKDKKTAEKLEGNWVKMFLPFCNDILFNNR